jgi:hypothetical protein
MEMEEIGQSIFENDSFRGFLAVRTTAYFTFYIGIAARIDGQLLLALLKLTFSQSVLNQGQAVNAHFLIEWIAFGLPFVKLVLECRLMPQLLDFYFTIFCHSRHETLAEAFPTQLNRLVDESTIDYLLTLFPAKVSLVYVSYSIIPIT